MANDVDALGGQILCSSARESVMYQSSHFHKGTPLAMSLIADTVLDPALLPEEIAAQREAARYELREVSSKPEMILPEVLHDVAYGGQGLGNPLLCPEDRIDQIDAPMMRNVMETWYRPERMVIAGAGMPHDALVELAEKHFAHLKGAEAAKPRSEARPSQQVPANLLHSSGQSSPSFLKSLTRSASSYLYNPEKDPSSSSSLPPGPSPYTGGHKFVYDPNTEFNHVYLGFEGVGIHDDDVYAAATMQVLLGGGGSFSAGTSFRVPSELAFSQIELTPRVYQAAPERVCTPVCTRTSSTISRKSTTAHPSTTSTPIPPCSACLRPSSPRAAVRQTPPHTSSPTSSTS